MATCYNKNTALYKALQVEYKSTLRVDGYIDSYQRVSKSDEIPTVANIKEMLKRRQVMMSLKKRDYKKSILANLSRNKLINYHFGQYKVNHSNPVTQKYSPVILQTNYNYILKRFQIMFLLLILFTLNLM